MSEQRWIMHIDMDAFYASIEQLDHPAYRGRPLAVGEGTRAVVAAASYEARKFGIHSAMPVAQAKRLCPGCIFTPLRMRRYKQVSAQVMETLRMFSPAVEQASVDEAYIDATGLEHLFGPPETLARSVKEEIFHATSLTCSVGLAPIKFLAKIASDARKPNGLTVVGPSEVPGFLGALPIEKFPGVGRKTLDLLQKFGIRRGADVLRNPRSFWKDRFGVSGERLWLKAAGLDAAPVLPQTTPKSESAECTFACDTLDREILKTALLEHAERICARVRSHGLKGRRITLKIKFSDFQIITRSLTLGQPLDSTQKIFEASLHLLAKTPLPKKIRLIGLGISEFGNGPDQLFLFPDPDQPLHRKEEALNRAIDAVRKKFGESSLVRGRLLEAAGKKHC